MFPALTLSSLGPSLIESDFNYLYPLNTMELLTKFEPFIQNFIKYIDDNYMHFGTNGLEYIAELNNPKRPVYAALWLFPLIFPPLCIKHTVKNNKKSSWRPSKVEQACSFIRFINNVNDVKNTQKSIVKKAYTFGLTVQPYILTVGSIFEEIYSEERIQSFLVINSTKYKFETPLKAVDTCFKSFFTFN
ncbi:unnamed protein product [Macrosiphum euphorbiae]|uniref:Uncharacterized protein n=1 Tax=Macrosiphum euphorbiae TaxID=13131 RepID=A0AAV0WU02_9HEMI|nr:unnamed protein product [Macrosiphum euphorbiae]